MQTQILIRLPIKSIITCTSVSKTWKFLIQNRTFISTHLHHSNNNNHYLLFRLYEDGEDIKEQYFLHNDDDFTEHTRFDFPLKSHNDKPIFGVGVVGTCNSMICLSHNTSLCFDEYFLWNPCVRKFVKLPSPNGTLLSSHVGMETRVYMGFGFDSKNNDYKVVRVLFHIQTDIPEYQCEVEVYSLSTGEWRMVTVSLPNCDLFLHTKPKGSVNGALHWLAYRHTDDRNIHCFILAFDLGDEVFREIVLPEIMGFGDGANISVYGNSIAFFLMKECLNVRRQIIWVMKEYGVVSSWTKVLTIDDYVPGHAEGFRRNGEVLLSTEEGLYASLDLENQKTKDLGISSDGFFLVGSYVESLVLLDMAANGAVTY
uniref:F-box domain-containing protein n=1 Tax=Fagus sylvatica TaxID=28930 RepID=A0A2N9FYF7_FAGSY